MDQMIHLRLRCGRPAGSECRPFLDPALCASALTQTEHSLSLMRMAAGDAVQTKDTAAEGRGDVAVRQGAGDGDGVALGGDDGAALEHAAEAFDVGGGPGGEIAHGALTDPATLAVA